MKILLILKGNFCCADGFFCRRSVLLLMIILGRMMVRSKRLFFEKIDEKGIPTLARSNETILS